MFFAKVKRVSPWRRHESSLGRLALRLGEGRLAYTKGLAQANLGEKKKLDAALVCLGEQSFT